MQCSEKAMYYSRAREGSRAGQGRAGQGSMLFASAPLSLQTQRYACERTQRM